MKRYQTVWMVILSFIVGCISIVNVEALSDVNNTFIMRELVAGIMTKAQGKIGNDEYFNGRGGAGFDDFKVMISNVNNEFVYCIEPGVVSIDNSHYQGSNVPLLFLKAYNAKTSPESKYLNVSKLLQLVQTKYRYDDGTDETRIHYMVIQTLIWEVMCEERGEKFEYVGPKNGTTAITYLLRGTNQQHLNRFNALYEEYENKMVQYAVIPSFTSPQINKAPILYLDQYDEKTKEYYTILEDQNEVIQRFDFKTDDQVHLTVNGNQIKITCKIADYSGEVNGYNTWIQGDILNPKSFIVGHSQGNNQALVSISSISEQKSHVFFKIKTDNFMGTLTIDPNGGHYNGKHDLTVIKKMAGETELITPATREGYSFDRWQLLGVGQYQDNFYTFSKGQATLTAQWVNHTPVIIGPVVNGGGAFIEGEDLIIQLGDKFEALKHATAHDEEDGDITDKLIVISNEVPIDEHFNTVRSGQYKVTYQINDRAGATVQKSISVIVNDPPVIKATDRYFFVDDEITDQLLLKGAQAIDKEDGDITNKVEIAKKNYNEHMEGEGNITFTVTDRYHKRVEKTVNIHFLYAKENESEKNIRYISSDYINTLLPNSKWKKNLSIQLILNDSLNKEANDQNSLYIFEWNKEDNESLKQQLLSNGQILDLSFFNAYRQK